MLEDLWSVPWGDLEHAYGPADDVPGLLHALLDPDPKVRSQTIHALYGNVFHQGTRYPATPHVIPFLIELCGSPATPDRGDLLLLWGSLITGYFSVQERPIWGDGEHIYWYGDILDNTADTMPVDFFVASLHHIYRASLKGYPLLRDLLTSDEIGVRAGAAWVLACLPTLAASSVPTLEAHLVSEPSGWVRASMAFALGELGAPDTLRRIVAQDSFPAARCMAACQLARIDPTHVSGEMLIRFVAEPIDGYERIPGAGGRSTGDAAFALSHLPIDIQRQSIPAICDQLDQAHMFDTIPLVHTLLSALFSERDELLTEVTEVQRQVLTRMVATQELWSIGNLSGAFTSVGLRHDRHWCAHLVGVTVVEDTALKTLRTGLAFADVGFLEKACERILEALALDTTVIDRAPAPDMAWLLCAKAFAGSDPQRAIFAFQRAAAITPHVRMRVEPTWQLADLLHQQGLD